MFLNLKISLPRIIPTSSCFWLAYTWRVLDSYKLHCDGNSVSSRKKSFYSAIIASVFLYPSLRVSVPRSQSCLDFYAVFCIVLFCFLLVSEPQYNNKVLSAYLSQYLLPLTTSKCFVSWVP